MARPRAAPDPTLPGPARWSFRHYSIHERTTPRGRRYEIRSPSKALVALCRSKRNDEDLVFFADEYEEQELIRLVPKTVRQYAASFEVRDVPSSRPIGEFRKKLYKPLGKSEWFVFSPDGEQVGLLTEGAGPSTLLRRLLPSQVLPKSYQLHWGQAIGGTVSRSRIWPGIDKTSVDLSLDQKDTIDRRLALTLAVLMRHDEKNGELTR